MLSLTFHKCLNINLNILTSLRILMETIVSIGRFVWEPFFKSLDEQVWTTFKIKWKHPENVVAVWSTIVKSSCNWNNKGLNAIFMVVSPK